MNEDDAISGVQDTVIRSGRPTVVRVRGLPRDKQLAEVYVRQTIERHSRCLPKYEISIVSSCWPHEDSDALIDFEVLPDFLADLQHNPLDSWQTCTDGQDLLFDQHFFGFTQLYEPAGDPRADIIAICGVDGHGYGSWQGRGSLRRMWLRHFLAKDLPNCRTMTYGHNSKLVVRSSATLEDYALEFMESLRLIRTKESAKRPIVFIAHSFGGLVLARSITKAKLRDAQPSLPSILGILFFAVPHRGIDIQDMSKIMGAQFHPRTTLLQQIDLSSEVLKRQLQDFVDITANIKIVSFYETEQSRRLIRDATGTWKRTGEPFTSLEASSAVLQLPSHMETRIPLHTDHSNVVKFDNQTDPQYCHAITQLRSILNQRTRTKAMQQLQIATNDHRSPDAKVRGHALPHYMLPLRNPGFVERQNILEDLEQRIFTNEQIRRLAIYGLGGIGKTQTVLAFCYTIKARLLEYSIFWISALDSTSLRRDLAKLAKICSLPLSPSMDDSISSVQDYLSSPDAGRWLLVVENADDDRLLENLPQSETGKILFTTRYKDTAVDLAGADIFHLGQMSFPEAETFLSRLLPSYDLASNAQATRDLVEDLAYLPLAIAQVATYINKSSMSISQCLDIMRRSEDELIRLLTREFRDLTRSGEENRSAVATTWLKSFKRMRDKEPEALSTLLLLGSSSFDLAQGLPPVSRSDNLFHISGVLIGYSFLTNKAQQRCRIHPLVRLMAKQWIQKENAVDPSLVQATHLSTTTSLEMERQE